MHPPDEDSDETAAESGTWWPTDQLPARRSGDALTPTRVAKESANATNWTGVVNGVRQRTEQAWRGKRQVADQVITFRLASFDTRGDRVGVAAVEMRGETLTGEVAEGDRVEVFGKQAGGVVQARKVRNLTTGATLQPVRKKPGWASALAKIVAALLVLAVVAVLALRFDPGLTSQVTQLVRPQTSPTLQVRGPEPGITPKPIGSPATH